MTNQGGTPQEQEDRMSEQTDKENTTNGEKEETEGCSIRAASDVWAYLNDGLELPSAHDHGNCELCDWIEQKLAALSAEHERVKKENERFLRELGTMGNAMDNLTAPTELELSAASVENGQHPKPQAKRLRERATMNILTLDEPYPAVTKKIVRQLLSALEVAERAIQAAEAEHERLRTILQAIAGLVNAYHNDGTTLSAAESLKAVADVLGKPMESAALQQAEAHD